MGFISTILIDGVLITTMLAGVRRYTGWSAYNAFESKIPNYTGRLAFRKYLEAGEWCVDKGKSVLEQMSTKGNMARDASHSAGHPNPSGAIGDVFQAPPGRDKNQWGF